MSLIIAPYVKEIIAAVTEHEVVQVNAATGSGKSIGTPKALAEEGLRVFVSVPTRISATSLAGYLATLNPALRVGFAAEGNSQYDARTQVVYATSGHVRRKMLSLFKDGEVKSPKGLDFTDVLILDETHSGSLDNTVILSLWMYAREIGARVPKLMFLSATPSDLPVEPKPFVVDVPVPTPFPVEIVYRGGETDDPFDTGSDNSIYQQAVDIAQEYHTKLDEGDFIIFAPGSREVDEIVATLTEILEDALVLPVYSALDSEDIQRIYEPLSEDKFRRILVATNILESSITVDGAILVIDTMTCREAMMSPSGATRLETVTITKDSAKQRLGRVGRTCPGTCVRVMYESDYNMLAAHRVPEIDRIPLHNTVMELMKAGIDPSEHIAGVSPDRVSSSVSLLSSLDLIKFSRADHKYTVTEAGNFVPTVPLGVHNAAFLYRWIEEGHPVYPGVVIACIIDVHNNGYFYIPRKKKHMGNEDYLMFCSDYIRKNFSRWIGDTPMHTFLNMWKSFVVQFGRNHYRLIDAPFTMNYRKWSRENSMNYRQLSDLVSIVSQTYKAVRSGSKRRLDVNVFVFDVESDMKTASEILADVYKDHLVVRRFSDFISSRTGMSYKFDNRRCISAVEWDSKGSVIYLASHEMITQAGKHIAFIDLCIRTPPPKPVQPEPEWTATTASSSSEDSGSSSESEEETSSSSSSSENDDEIFAHAMRNAARANGYKFKF